MTTGSILSALLLIVIVPLKGPAPVGLKLMATFCAVPPEAMSKAVADVTANGAPLLTTLEMLSVALPVLLTTRD